MKRRSTIPQHRRLEAEQLLIPAVWDVLSVEAKNALKVTPDTEEARAAWANQYSVSAPCLVQATIYWQEDFEIHSASGLPPAPWDLRRQEIAMRSPAVGSHLETKSIATVAKAQEMKCQYVEQRERRREHLEAFLPDSSAELAHITAEIDAEKRRPQV